MKNGYVAYYHWEHLGEIVFRGEDPKFTFEYIKFKKVIRPCQFLFRVYFFLNILLCT